MITSGTGKHQVNLEKQRIGDHLLFVVQGGEKPHIGAVIICEPEKDAVISTLGSHKDHIVLTPLAKKACEKYQTTVVVTGGIHIDHASQKDIDLVIKNCKRLESCI